MHTLLLILGLRFFGGDLAHSEKAHDLSSFFKGKNGCFELYDMHARKNVIRFGGVNCGERLVVCSTFKVPLALMAFDRGVLKDENTQLKWDGQDYGMPDWNRDQSAASWIKNSVVWYSQRLTQQLGLETIQSYLARFDFGNQDMSGGLTTAWLSSTLKMSADEQLRFWRRFWYGELPVSSHALETTRKITYIETSPAGARLSGKTGSGFMGRGPTSQLGDTQVGWFAGHLKTERGEYVFVTNFTQPLRVNGPKFGGLVARQMTKDILKRLALF